MRATRARKNSEKTKRSAESTRHFRACFFVLITAPVVASETHKRSRMTFGHRNQGPQSTRAEEHARGRAWRRLRSRQFSFPQRDSPRSPRASGHIPDDLVKRILLRSVVAD